MVKEGKKIIIVAQGGLANRMRAIASGLVLARKTYRDLLVVWYKNVELNASFSDLFTVSNLPFEIIEPSQIKYNILYEQPRKRNFWISGITRRLLGIKSIINIHLQSEKESIEDLVENDKTIIINSGLQFAEFESKILHEIFQFNDNVREKTQSILDGCMPHKALQIRRTDNCKSIKRSHLHAFEEIIKSGLKNNENELYFLATDDFKTKCYLSSQYPNNIITNPREARRDTKDGMIDAAAEMLIMSKCKIIFGSYWSSFSELAAMYGECELKVVDTMEGRC